MPDPSTLRKFVKRLEPKILELILSSLASFVCGQGMTVAVDATGFSCSNASRHFVKRMKQMGSYVTSVRNYVKTSLAVDTETLVVLACKSSVSKVHDSKHVPELLDMLAREGLTFSMYWRTKGTIPKTPAGTNRKAMFRDFPKELYDRRCLVETVNSMIKRKMGDSVHGKNEHSMCMKVLFRCVSHNFKRLFELRVI